MGRRARSRGISNATRRGLRAALFEADEQVAAIATRVYNVGAELKRDGFSDEQLPPTVWIPLQAAMEAAAPGAAALADLELSERSVRDVAAYLMAGARELIVMLDTEHYRAWLEAAGARADPAE